MFLVVIGNLYVEDLDHFHAWLDSDRLMEIAVYESDAALTPVLIGTVLAANIASFMTFWRVIVLYYGETCFFHKTNTSIMVYHTLSKQVKQQKSNCISKSYFSLLSLGDIWPRLPAVQVKTYKITRSRIAHFLYTWPLLYKKNLFVQTSANFLFNFCIFIHFFASIPWKKKNLSTKSYHKS